MAIIPARVPLRIEEIELLERWFGWGTTIDAADDSVRKGDCVWMHDLQREVCHAPVGGGCTPGPPCAVNRTTYFSQPCMRPGAPWV